MNPFVSAEGDLIIWRGPDVPVIDLEITMEEIAYGLAIGVRLFAVAVLVGAVLAHMDADRLQAQVARVAPRSALTCALAARLIPTLERDARAIAETARLRGVTWPPAAGAPGRGARRRSRCRCSGRAWSAASTSPRPWPPAATGPGRAPACAERRYGPAERVVLVHRRRPVRRWRPRRSPSAWPPTTTTRPSTRCWRPARSPWPRPLLAALGGAALALRRLP